MKILIVDQNILFTEGVKCLLNSSGIDTDTHYASDTQVALDIISKKGVPNLILLDANLFDNGGYDLIEMLHKMTVFSPVIIISEIKSPTLEKLVIDAGASGFITKACKRSILLGAIGTALKGGVYNNNYKRKREFSHSKPKIKITKRQYEILLLLSEGLLNKQIAEELSISTHTVSAHLHEIFGKLNVTNRTAAVQCAHKAGLIPAT